MKTDSIISELGAKLNQHEDIGDNHVMTNSDTPLRRDAFDMSDEDKKKEIEYHFAKIMDILGLDMTDDSLQGTPHRVAKMFVKRYSTDLTQTANRAYRLLKTSTTMTKCWWRKT